MCTNETKLILHVFEILLKLIPIINYPLIAHMQAHDNLE